jgi:hypothetical protein
LKKTQIIVARASFISLSANEITTLDNQSGLLVQVYVMHAWKKIPIFSQFNVLLKVEMQIIFCCDYLIPYLARGFDSRREN